MNTCSTLPACAVLTELRDRGGVKVITDDAGLPSTSERVTCPLMPPEVLNFKSTHVFLLCLHTAKDQKLGDAKAQKQGNWCLVSFQWMQTSVQPGLQCVHYTDFSTNLSWDGQSTTLWKREGVGRGGLEGREDRAIIQIYYLE